MVSLDMSRGLLMDPATLLEAQNKSSFLGREEVEEANFVL
jgi:hypothetical protein